MTAKEADLRPALISFARNLTKNPDTAEDLVQDALVRTWERKGMIDDEKLEQYLFQSVMNAFIDHKRRKRTQTFTEAWPDGIPKAAWVDPHTPESVALGVTIDAPLCDRWALLRADERLILTMASDDATGMEIADALGITLSAARCRLARIRARCIAV
jgi:RNA polymerase sigma-70 factor (ECF subfamily)